MGQLTYTTAEIQALLDAIGDISDLTGYSATDLVAAILELQNNVADDIDDVDDKVGDLSDLDTTSQSSLVAAINEVFTSASDIKSTIATAITGAGVATSASDTVSTMATNIGQIPDVARSGYIYPYVTNGDSITPTGTYATSTYYNTTFGVKVGYTASGDVLILMEAGTSTAYEYLYFSLASAPSGVTLTEVHNTSTSYVTGPAGLIYGCVLSGITEDVTIEIAMGTINASYDYVNCAITVTAA